MRLLRAVRMIMLAGAMCVVSPGCEKEISPFLPEQSSVGKANNTEELAQIRQWYTTSHATQADISELLLWEQATSRADETGAIYFIPVTDNDLLAGHAYRGDRRLVVRRNASSHWEGFVVELLTAATTAQPAPEQLEDHFFNLFKNFTDPAVGAPAELTGRAFLYNADYQYLKGKILQDASVIDNARLLLAQGFDTTGTSPAARCTDWYQTAGGVTSYIMTTCVPNMHDGPSGYSGQGHFGWGGTRGPGSTGAGGPGGGSTGPVAPLSLLNSLLVDNTAL